MNDDLIRFVRDMDRCWMEGRFDDLRSFIAADVVMVAPGGQVMEGVDTAIESYREFMGRCRVDRFETFDHRITERGDTAVVEYRWDMAWVGGDTAHGAQGREVLVLARRDGAWRVIWRTQLAA
ncbi:MAG: SnoaL-like domain [Sphingomonadales bacterium]|jgi:ketosteroid isomerase-like protein|nr:SnoaL-like domain [Sphingomonadales bacterium]